MLVSTTIADKLMSGFIQPFDEVFILSEPDEPVCVFISDTEERLLIITIQGACADFSAYKEADESERVSFNLYDAVDPRVRQRAIISLSQDLDAYFPTSDKYPDWLGFQTYLAKFKEKLSIGIKSVSKRRRHS